MAAAAQLKRFIFRKVLLPLNHFKFKTLYGMDIGEHARISRTARLDMTNPKGIHIGSHTAVVGGASVLSHDFVNRQWHDTYVGSHCFIGYNAVILPGVKVGNHCIVSANTVVARDVPDNSVVVGNPGRVVERDIVTGPWGIRLDKGNDSEVAY
ncbi:acyltransferase [Paracoccaceae bacterium GXU_MW_L88]